MHKAVVTVVSFNPELDIRRVVAACIITSTYSYFSTLRTPTPPNPNDKVLSYYIHIHHSISIYWRICLGSLCFGRQCHDARIDFYKQHPLLLPMRLYDTTRHSKIQLTLYLTTH